MYGEHLNIFLNPNDPEIIKEAEKQGIPHNVLEAAKNSPIYKMAIDWKIAFPLHPEYRTLPMVWYVPPLSPIVNAAESGKLGKNGILPDVEQLRIPNKYLANLFTAGDEAPIKDTLKRMLAMRAFMRSKTVDKELNTEVLEGTGLTPKQVEDMYHLLAIANYEDRFVIPTSHKEYADDAFGTKASCGFSDDSGCGNDNLKNLFGGF